MNGNEMNKLLRELSMVEESHEGAIPSDERLRAYREGALSDEEVHELETLLAENADARERLAALSGVTLPKPSPRVREAVLRQTDGLRKPQSSGLRIKPWIGALAASLMLALGLWFFHQTSQVPLFSKDMAWDVSVAGYRSERGVEVGGWKVSAWPENEVTIHLTPRGSVTDWTSFALYRQSGQRLERLPAGSDLSVETARGSAAFSARAETLVGSEPGTRSLYVIVAHESNLPQFLPFSPDANPQSALAKAGQRLIYPIQITVLHSENQR